MSHSSGNPFPSQKHELLLKSALMEGEMALSAFYEWKKLVNFEEDIEYASFRMLPLLYMNLSRQDVQDELMPRLKGIYRKSWSKNQLLFYKTGKVLKFLQDQGIKTLVMKGIPLSVIIYKNFAVRPMADMDILIPYVEARKTVELLQNAGWILRNPHYLEFNLKYGRSATFADDENTELDLHWHPIFEAHGDISENDFWDMAIPFEVAGVKTLSFCATDIFFQTIVHGLRYNPEPPIRWIADGLALLRDQEHPLDWERLINYTRKFRVSLYMKDALNYLVRTFDAPAPASKLKEIESIRVSSVEKLIFRHSQKFGDKDPDTFTEKIYSVYAAYMRQTNKNGFIARHAGFINYLRFRNKGKPFFKIVVYQISLFFKNNLRIKK